MPEDSTYGKKFDYDPLWQGPLRKQRVASDVWYLFAFVFFLIVWLIVAAFAFTTGNIANVLPPVDTEGRRCGIDIEVKTKPYLLFYNMTNCENGTCSTTQSCLKECPKTNFLYRMNDTDLEHVKSKLICKLGVDIPAVKSWEVLDRYIREEKCAKLYLESKSFFRRCIPKAIPDDFRDFITPETIAKIENFVDLEVGSENATATIGKAFSKNKFKIVGFLFLGIVFAALYLFSMRWMTRFLVYLTIFLVCALIFYFICQSALIYSSDNNRTDALTFLIIEVLVLVCIILFTIFFWRKINIACEVIKESCKATLALPATIVFPVFPFFFYVFLTALVVSVGIYLTTIIEPMYKVKMLNDGCSCPAELHYAEGASCEPQTFLDKCRTIGDQPCFESGCRFYNSTVPGHVSFMHGLNGIVYLWAIFFVSAFGHTVLAGTFATWYWTENKKLVPNSALFDFIKIVVKFHLGSLALGSLILTIARIIRQMVNNLKRNANRSNFALELLSCIVDAIDSALKFLSRYTYIMIAVHGHSFFTSAKEAFNLLMRNVLHVIVINKITDWVLLFGVFLITGLTTTFSWISLDSTINSNMNDNEKSTEILVLLLTTGIGTFFISSILIGVLKTAIDTIFICFLEDSERNDGSEDRPYLMSFKLRELLQVNNQ